MSRAKLTAKALGGDSLSASERARLSPAILALLAAGGHLTLSHADRRQLSKRSLVQLAMNGVIELTRPERDRLCPQELAMLAIDRRAELSESELNRIPRTLRPLVDRALQGGRRTAATSPSPRAIPRIPA